MDERSEFLARFEPFAGLDEDDLAAVASAQKQLARSWRSGGSSYALAGRRAASTVFRRSQTSVTGPTPPGTGVIASAFAATDS